jgi:hypothetical protein
MYWVAVFVINVFAAILIFSAVHTRDEVKAMSSADVRKATFGIALLLTALVWALVTVWEAYQ